MVSYVTNTDVLKHGRITNENVNGAAQSLNLKIKTNISVMIVVLNHTIVNPF
jgi:hypothetical protein